MVRTCFFGGGGGGKNFRTGGFLIAGGYFCRGGGQYPIKCHGSVQENFYCFLHRKKIHFSSPAEI